MLFSALIGQRSGSCMTIAIRSCSSAGSTVSVPTPSQRTVPSTGR
jgi:hypothetical protein